MFRTLRKIIFWCSIVFITIALLSITVGQYLPYEFADYEIQNFFYDTIILGLPFAVILTLFGTIKKSNTKLKNIIISISTILMTALCFISQLLLFFTLGFGVWTTESIIYMHKSDNREIKYQLFDIGAFGYGGNRIVETKPFMKYWILPIEIDTTTIEKNQWILVNQQGDIKFP
nr:hypothetical protein [uncultured Carboxylicivirga sp.]